MLHARRKRLERLAAAEAAGESFWTDHFDDMVRIKILYALRDAAGHYEEEVVATARALILRDEGRVSLTSSSRDAHADFIEYLAMCTDDMVPTVVEAIEAGSRKWQFFDWSFGDQVRNILREHRVSYDFIDGQMVEFSSQEMHEAVVAPALRLLSGRQGFAGAEQAYQDALEEIAKGKPADAITDAGTALQEALTAAGCEGNALGPLIKSARAKRLLAPHDQPLVDAIEKAMHWVSADRSESGDAHSSSAASVSDAWLIVHVVGALIVRLAEGTSRGG